MPKKRLDRKVYQGINRAMTPEFDRWAKRTHGISGKKLLAKVAAAEGGGTTQHPNVSSAGARGPFQFIGSTRAAYKKKYGLDAWRTNTEAAKAAMIHLKGTGIRGYNPGMSSYEGLVLGQDVDTNPLKTGKYGSSKTRGGGSTSRKVTETTPGVDNSAARRDLKLAYLAERGKPDALLNLAQGLEGAKDVPGRKVTRTVSGGGSRPVKGKDGIPRGTPAKGTKVFEGVRVAAWIHPYLVYGRKHGWKGKVTSGFRSRADQERIYASGVRPAARPGTSNHEGSDFPRGAIDVSDAETLNKILRRRGTKKLRFAGAKDPVHFSHPHGGSY